MATAVGTRVADERSQRSIGASVCALTAAASFFGSMVLAAGTPPALNALPWLAAAAFGFAAPIALVGAVLSLAAAQMSARGDSGGLLRACATAVDATALLGSAGLLLGAACLIADRLGPAAARFQAWPFVVHGAVFVVLAASVLAHRFRAGDDDADSDDDRDTAYGSAVQLVTDNTRALKLRHKAKASLKNGIRINTEAEFEMRDWSRKYDCTPEQLKAAVKAVGTMAADVEAYLATRH